MEREARELNRFPKPLKGIDPQPGEMYAGTWGPTLRKSTVHAFVVVPWQVDERLGMHVP